MRSEGGERIEFAVVLAVLWEPFPVVHLWHEKATRLEKYPSGRNEGPPFLRCYKVNCGAGGIWTRGLVVAKDAVKTCQPGETIRTRGSVARLWRERGALPPGASLSAVSV